MQVKATWSCIAALLLMCRIMRSWEQHCCLIPTTGPSFQPRWTTPCGSTALSAPTSGCCTSARAPGQVSESIVSCSRPGYWRWTRFPAVCFARRGQQGPRPGPTVAKGWRAGCVVFPGRCPKSETCHTAKQTLGTFPKIVFFFFLFNFNLKNVLI